MSTIETGNKSADPGGSKTPIGDFLDQFPTESTMRAYRSHLFNFIDALYGKQRAGRTFTPDEAARYEVLAADLLRQPAPTSVLARYVVSLAGSPPPTASQRFAVAVDWFAYHGHELGPRERKTLGRRLPQGGPQTMEADMDHETLRAIVQHLDLRGRTIVLVLVSSGMRIGEVLKVRSGDVNLKTVPAEIAIRGAYTKTGAPRTVFISAEAAEAVDAWLKVRGKAEDLAIARSAGLGGKVRGNRLFPYQSAAIRQAWGRAVHKAGRLEIDPVTNRATLHLHMLRKFFNSQMKKGAPGEVVEALMGHEGYLSGSYRRYTKAELAEFYEKAEMHVTIMVPVEYRALKSETAAKLETQRDLVDALTTKTIRTEARVAELEEQNRERDRVIRMLQNVLGAVDEDRGG